MDQRAGKRVVEPRRNRGTVQRGEGRPAEQRRIKDTKLNHLPCLCSSLRLTLTAYFQEDQHKGKQQRPSDCCYRFQTAIFPAKANIGTFDVRCACMDIAQVLGVYFLKKYTPVCRFPRVYWRDILQSAGPEPRGCSTQCCVST